MKCKNMKLVCIWKVYEEGIIWGGHEKDEICDARGQKKKLWPDTEHVCGIRKEKFRQWTSVSRRKEDWPRNISRMVQNAYGYVKIWSCRGYMQQTVNMVTGVDGGLHDPFTLCYLSLSCECAYCTEVVWIPLPVTRDDAMKNEWKMFYSHQGTFRGE